VREALAHYTSHGGTVINPDDVIVTPGAMAALHALWCALLAPGDEVITIAPDYFIEGSVQLAGGKLIRVPSDQGIRPGIQEAVGRIGRRTRAIYLSNPRNPTGQLLESSDFSTLADGLARNPGVVIVIDEAYERMNHAGGRVTSAWHDEALRPHLVVVRSFSKSFALPGLRLGWVVAPRWITSRVAEVLEWQQLYGSALTQTIAASAVLGDQAWLEKLRVRLTTSRDVMVRLLSQVPGLAFHVPSAGPFVYVDTGANGGSDGAPTSRLNALGVPAVSGAAFGDSPSRIRVPFSGPVEDVEEACELISSMSRWERKISPLIVTASSDNYRSKQDLDQLDRVGDRGPDHA
jgi:aspartate/methionine/tyrosine aminotransferase